MERCDCFCCKYYRRTAKPLSVFDCSKCLEEFQFDMWVKWQLCNPAWFCSASTCRSKCVFNKNLLILDSYQVQTFSHRFCLNTLGLDCITVPSWDGCFNSLTFLAKIGRFEKRQDGDTLMRLSTALCKCFNHLRCLHSYPSCYNIKGASDRLEFIMRMKLSSSSSVLFTLCSSSLQQKSP